MGPPLLASLVVVGSLSYLALAVWLPLLRRVITPVVSATVLMLIAVAVLPISLDRVQEVPQGAPGAAGPVVAAITLAVIVGLALRTGRGLAIVVSPHGHRRRLPGRPGVRHLRCPAGSLTLRGWELPEGIPPDSI